jgi:hypothetical protein
MKKVFIIEAPPSCRREMEPFLEHRVCLPQKAILVTTGDVCGEATTVVRCQGIRFSLPSSSVFETEAAAMARCREILVSYRDLIQVRIKEKEQEILFGKHLLSVIDAQ